MKYSLMDHATKDRTDWVLQHASQVTALKKWATPF